MKDKIDITIICPGFVLTEIHDKAHGSEKGVERNKKEFMTSEECSKLMVVN
jgi:short-subunit dehydrogenase